MDEVLIRFVQLLRAAGLRVSSSESLDALRGASTLGIEDRDAMKAALRATLIKRSDDIPIFDPLFDHFFGSAENEDGEGQPGAGQGNPLWQRQMDLETALRMALEELARRGQPPGELSRSVLRGDLASVLALMAMLGLLQRDADQQNGQQPTDGPSESRQPQRGQRQRGQRGQRGYGNPWEILGEMGWDEARQEMRAMIEALERMGERELARLLRQRIREVEELFPRWAAQEAAEAARRERDEQAASSGGGEGYSHEPLEPTDSALSKKDFSQFTPAEVRAMESLVAQLAKKLSHDMSRRRQEGGRKRLDFSRTMRASLGTNGVPMELWFKQQRRNRLRLVVLCDVSSSVRTASRFMLQLVYSLQQQRGRVRSFVFISDLTEVSSFFRTHPIDAAVQMATTEADIRYWSHSDFGRAFRIFLDRYPDAVTSRTVVLILGDGRSNFFDPQLDTLATIRQQAKRVIWLNPESRWGWGSGDSIIDVYAHECDVLEECRNLEQLAATLQLIAE